MGYFASYDGAFVAKNENSKKEIINILREHLCDMDLIEENISIDFSGYEKYRDDEWDIILDEIKPLVESGEVSFAGEDDYHWRFVFKDGDVLGENGKIVYDGDPKSFVVCLRESRIRDAQAYRAYLDEDEENEDEDDEEGWTDFSGPIFLKAVTADSVEAAIKMVAEEDGYNPSALEAYPVETR